MNANNILLTADDTLSLVLRKKDSICVMNALQFNTATQLYAKNPHCGFLEKKNSIMECRKNIIRQYL
jgi:hypothetical protein